MFWKLIRINKNFQYFSAQNCHSVGGQAVYYDPSCLNPGQDPKGGQGCNAGGQGQGCRFV